jgi:uncharacterized protein YndB with AHSA1/START domain
MGDLKQNRQFGPSGRGEIRLPDGMSPAECQAIVVRPPQEIVERWEAEKSHWHVYNDE